MADLDTIEQTDTDTSAADQSRPSGSPKPGNGRRVIVAGDPQGLDAQGRNIIITEIRREVRAKSKVTISGLRLNVYNEVKLLIGGKLWEPIEPHRAFKDNDPIVFYIPDFNQENLLNDGSQIWIQLSSELVPAADATIQPYLIYSTKEDEQDQEENSAQKKAEEAQNSQVKGLPKGGVGPTAMMLGAMGDTIGGVVQPFLPDAVLKQQNIKNLEEALKSGNKEDIKKFIAQAKKLGDIDGLKRALKTAKNKEDIEAINSVIKDSDSSKFKPVQASGQEMADVTSQYKVNASAQTDDDSSDEAAETQAVESQTISQTGQVTAAATGSTQVSGRSATIGNSSTTNVTGSVSQSQSAAGSQTAGASQVSTKGSSEVSAAVSGGSQGVTATDAVSQSRAAGAASAANVATQASVPSGGGSAGITASGAASGQISRQVQGASSVPAANKLSPAVPAGKAQDLESLTTAKGELSSTRKTQSGQPQAVTSPQSLRPASSARLQASPVPPPLPPQSRNLPGNGSVDGVGFASSSPSQNQKSSYARKISVNEAAGSLKISAQTAGGGIDGASSKPPKGVETTLDAFLKRNLEIDKRLAPQNAGTDKINPLGKISSGGPSVGQQAREKQQESFEAGSNQNRAPQISGGDSFGQDSGENGSLPPGAPGKAADKPSGQQPQGKEQAGDTEQDKGQQDNDGDDENPEQDDSPIVAQRRLLEQSAAQTIKVDGAEVQRITKEASKLLNAFLMEEGVIPLWAFAIPSFGLTILLGAILGDFLFLVKNSILKRILDKLLTTEELKKKSQEIARQIKISGIIKFNIFLMNVIVAVVPLVAIILILFVACNDPLASRAIGGLTAQGSVATVQSLVTGNSGFCAPFSLSGKITSIISNSNATPAPNSNPAQTTTVVPRGNP